MPIIQRTCVTCGGVYPIDESVIEQDKKSACSPACKYLDQTRVATLFYYPDTGEKVFYDELRKASLKRKCDICEKEYFALLINVKKGYGRVCSRDCAAELRRRELGHKPSIVTECSICRKSFRLHISRQEVGRGKYCSKRCENIGRRKEKIPLTCEHCKKVFYKKPYKLRQLETGYVKKVYCSQKCTHEHKVTGEIILCGYCGKEFYRQVGQINKRYCCASCYNKAVCGENHHLYKAFKIPRNMHEFSGPEKRSILINYDFCCAVTGLHISEALIHFHHIRPISEGGSHDIYNGIPLIVPVHKQVHLGLLDLTPYIQPMRVMGL